MLHSDSVQHAVDAREDRDVLLCSAWLLACALLLQEQPPSPRPAQLRKSSECHIAAASRTT